MDTEDLTPENIELLFADYPSKQEIVLDQMIKFLRKQEIDHRANSINGPSGKEIMTQMIHNGEMTLSLFFSILPAVEDPYSPYEITLK